jgi:tetratricopeptide (TPR) repeat protein
MKKLIMSIFIIHWVLDPRANNGDGKMKLGTGRKHTRGNAAQNGARRHFPKKLFAVLLIGLSSAAALSADNLFEAEEYVNQGNVYYGEGELDRAIEDYTHAIRLKADYAAAYLNRGLAYHSKGEYDQAIADWEKVLQINPNLVQARDNLEWLRGNITDE